MTRIRLRAMQSQLNRAMYSAASFAVPAPKCGAKDWGSGASMWLPIQASNDIRRSMTVWR